jgi:hypothetical protein
MEHWGAIWGRYVADHMISAGLNISKKQVKLMLFIWETCSYQCIEPAESRAWLLFLFFLLAGDRH